MASPIGLLANRGILHLKFESIESYAWTYRPPSDVRVFENQLPGFPTAGHLLNNHI
jgi:hypothetical protein